LLSTIRRALRRSDDRGQILVLFAGGLVTLLIIAALAFDVGMVLLERRDQQNAADAAALAGARFVLSSHADAEAAARDIAGENGFDDTDPNQVVRVYIPAVHGRYAGLPDFIEVQIESTRPSLFGGVIGKAVWPVGAFAVATNKQNLAFPFSMLALDPTACWSIKVSGQGDLVSAGSIQSNSNGDECTTGGANGFARVGGADIQVGADVYCRSVGGILDQGSGDFGDCIKAPNSFALPDPLRNLPAPAMPDPPSLLGKVEHALDAPRGCPTSSQPATVTSPALCDLGGNGAAYSGKAWVLYPGLYPGGISITNDAVAYMMPGIYWIGGGGLNVQRGTIITVQTAPTTVAGAPTSAAGGVLIYNSRLTSSPGGTISQNATYANVQLKPIQDPSSIYRNIVIFQDRTLDITGYDVTLNGSSSGIHVEGMVYVPSGDVRLNGNGGTLTVGQIIANTYMIDGGHGTIQVTEDDLYKAIIVAAGLVD
jgi:hypothetical protein